MKDYLLKTPEFYLLIGVVLAGYIPPFGFATPHLIIGLLVTAQIITRNKWSGLIGGILFLLGSLFFCGALLSELAEFEVMTTSARKLAAVGIPLSILNLCFAGLMIYHYVLQHTSTSPLPQSSAGNKQLS